jgi:16S rRNA (cytidine1402-2'-O)-methyltransferase
MAQDGSQPNDRVMGGRTTTTHPTGTLYVVSMPIGHPDDITLRALATLRFASVVASEDPRATQALLAHHGITATITSYGRHDRGTKIRLLLLRLTQGENVVLVSDNGTPIIYDPGSQLVASAHQAGIPVKTVPGPSPMTAATAISGFSGDAIIFEGKVPPTGRRLAEYLFRFRKEKKTFVFYGNPGTLKRLLKILVQILPTRQVAVAIDLTTDREILTRGTPGELLARIVPMPKNSAVTIVIEGYSGIAHKQDKRTRAVRYSSARRRISTR